MEEPTAAAGGAVHRPDAVEYDDEAGARQHGGGGAADSGPGELAADIDPAKVAEIARNVQVEMATQLKAIMEEMNRLKGELYSDTGGLADVQRSLEMLKASANQTSGSPADARAHALTRVQGDADADSSEENEDGASPGVRKRNVQFSDCTTFREKQPRPPGMTNAQQRAIEMNRMRRGRGREEHGGFSWRLALLVLFILLLGPFRGVLRELYRFATGWRGEADEDPDSYLIEYD